MAKRFALYFSATGYVVAVLRYQPHAWWMTGKLYYFLQDACMCLPHLDPSPGVVGTLLFFAPVNAIIYGAVGFVIGKVILKIRQPSG